jgi:hypothetical protein
MMKSLLPLASLALLVAAPALEAAAAGLRCGNDLVQRGDSIVHVRQKCGDPLHQADLVNDRGKVIGTVLYFDPGYGRKDRRVTFRGGRVVSIERLR